jgi:hypothetical protein
LPFKSEAQTAIPASDPDAGAAAGAPAP